MGNTSTAKGYQSLSETSLNLDELLKHANQYTEKQLHQIWESGVLPAEDIPKFFQAARSLKTWTIGVAKKASSKMKPCDDSCKYYNSDAEGLELPYLSLQDLFHIRVAHPDLYAKLRTTARRIHRFRSEANLVSSTQENKEEEDEQPDESKEEKHDAGGNNTAMNDNNTSLKVNFLQQRTHAISVISATKDCSDAEGCDKYKELLSKYKSIHESDPKVNLEIWNHCILHHPLDYAPTQCTCSHWQPQSPEYQHLIHGHWYHQHMAHQLVQEKKQKKKKKARTAPVKYTNQSKRKSLKIQIPSSQPAEFTFGAPFQVKDEQEATFKNPKEEMLQNSYHALTSTLWNVLLRKCILFAKTVEARKSNLNVKEIVALKLYTDYDTLQREYRRCFRQSKGDSTITRQRQFYHWNNLLQIACNKSRNTVTDPLYHGVSGDFSFGAFTGTYYGPVSTTTLHTVAEQFAGSDGKILELYPAFGKRGLRVHWLSNFPDEEEILYMNTTFQIRNIYRPNQPVTPKTPVLGGFNVSNENQAREFEKAVLTAIQSINMEYSTVISLNSQEDIDSKADDNSGFVELSSRTQLAVLYLLYLQYRQDEWNEFIQKSDPNVRRAFTAFRQDFVRLAENVRAIKMERLSKALQVFFYSDQQYYRFPIDLYGEEDDKKKAEVLNFQPKQPIRIETVVRLFPNAQQISINADNWDFSLNTFIAWLQTFDMDYANVRLQDIYIKFNNEKRIHGSNRVQHEIVTDDVRALSLLNAKAGVTAEHQLGILRKLGWQIMTPSHLHRVGFEPAPELPFVMVFVKPSESKRLFYQSYSMQFTSQQVRGFGDLHADEQPGLPLNETKTQSVDEMQLEGDQYVVVHHNPANCILSANVFNALEYKKELIELLEFRKKHWMHDALRYQQENRKKAKFIELCGMVETLVLDPMPDALKEVFMEDTAKRGIISFETIYQMFPNVEEIFLRHTALSLRICYKLIEFEQKYGKKRNDEDSPLKLKWIFFKNDHEISDKHAMRFQLALAPHSWQMVKSVAMLQKL